MGDITDAIVLTVGREVIVNKLLIGAKVLPVKTTLDVLSKEHHSIVIALEVGLESCVMSSKSHVKLLRKTAVYLAPNFAKMVDIVETQTMEQTAMSVFVALVSKEVIVRKI